MKKSSIIILSVIGLVLIIGFSIISKATGTYDKAVNYQETSSQAWGNVEATYQRRSSQTPIRPTARTARLENLARTVPAQLATMARNQMIQ